MNIDERLEALTQSVELLGQIQKDTDKQVRQLGKYIRAVAGMVLDHEARLRPLEGKDNSSEEDTQ